MLRRRRWLVLMRWREWCGPRPPDDGFPGQRIRVRLWKVEIERMYGTRLPARVMTASAFLDDGWIVADDLEDSLLALVRWRDGVLMIRRV